MRYLATTWLAILVCLPGLAVAQSSAKDPETLAAQVLAALKNKDQQALETLTINEAEFKKYIWPTIAARVTGGGGQMSAQRFYAMYRKNSEVAATQHVQEYGGKTYDLVKVNTGEAKQYNGYRLMQNPEVTLRDAGGEEKVLKLGSALIEHDGSYKVASFYRAPDRAKQ